MKDSNLYNMINIPDDKSIHDMLYDPNTFPYGPSKERVDAKRQEIINAHLDTLEELIRKFPEQAKQIISNL